MALALYAIRGHHFWLQTIQRSWLCQSDYLYRGSIFLLSGEDVLFGQVLLRNISLTLMANGKLQALWIDWKLTTQRHVPASSIE